MALYEAIRQGQVNIAKGLESGKLRSDGVSQEPVEPAVQDNTALFRIKEKSFIAGIPFKIWAVAAGVVGFVILLLLIGLILSSGDETVVPDESPGMSQTSSETGPLQEPKEESTGFLGFGRNKTTQPEAKEPASMMPLSTGDNVIVIASIPASRRDALDVLNEYFSKNSIPTKTVIDRNGYALLVTQQGFKENPGREGTAGNRLMQRIKQLGLQYPDNTGDTKFGQKPFQDAWSLNLEK